MEIANTSLNLIILLLRIAVVLLLYFFLYQVLRSVVRDLRSAGQTPASAGGRSPYGQMVVVRAGQGARRYTFCLARGLGFFSAALALASWAGEGDVRCRSQSE